MEHETGMIFLHSGFRTASTWVWSRFRANTGTLSYYEVFNERLGRPDAPDRTGAERTDLAIRNIRL
jgi:hypothetical protein